MHQRKSKAWIIVLIVVILLVTVVYVLFSDREQIFGTKNAEKITKTFSPLLGSSKKTETTNTGNTTGTDIVTTSTDNTGTGTTTGSLSNGDGLNTGDGLGTGEGFGNTGGSGTRNNQGGSNYTPPLSPLPTPGSSTGSGTTTTTTTTTSTPPIRVNPPDPNFCYDDPLVFTDAEKEELASLLRQYYLIAPTIKTTDDLALANNDISTNQALLDQVESLTNQCTIEKSSFGYTGPQIVKDNPYYNDVTNTNGVPYISAFSLLEEIFKIW